MRALRESASVRVSQEVRRGEVWLLASVIRTPKKSDSLITLGNCVVENMDNLG
jgi:hypothetical protein